MPYCLLTPNPPFAVLPVTLASGGPLKFKSVEELAGHWKRWGALPPGSLCSSQQLSWHMGHPRCPLQWVSGQHLPVEAATSAPEGSPSQCLVGLSCRQGARPCSSGGLDPSTEAQSKECVFLPCVLCLSRGGGSGCFLCLLFLYP